jgi:hypothetical protein
MLQWVRDTLGDRPFLYAGKPSSRRAVDGAREKYTPRSLMSGPSDTPEHENQRTAADERALILAGIPARRGCRFNHCGY